jgi:hypothetical protein
MRIAGKLSITNFSSNAKIIRIVKLNEISRRLIDEKQSLTI